MAVVDPYAALATTRLTPRTPSLVDAVSEAQRVAESIARSNPLTNAKIDGGLMVWRGNYAGSGGIADSLLWIGDFLPQDAVKGKAQRGFALTRDDSKHGWALYLFDPQGAARGVGNPLRQRVFMRDADNKQIMSEAAGGGLAWPYGQIPLYSSNLEFQSTRTDSGGTLTFVPLPPGIVRNATVGNYFKGFGAMIGHRLRLFVNCWSSGGATFQVRFRALFFDGQPDYTSSWAVINPGQSLDQVWDIDFAGQDKVGRKVHVIVEAQVTSGTPEWCTIFPLSCYSYGDS